MALAEAETQKVRYVFATDPDADRFICAERGDEGVGVESARDE